jgi:hypothetical protein
MHELMLAGHSASYCDLSISVQDLALDVPQFQNMKFDGAASSTCSDSSTLPAPRKFCKKSSDHDYCSDLGFPTSSLETKRIFRQVLGLALVEDEAASWTSSAELRKVSAQNVPKLFFTSDPKQ